jgi:putative transposase
MNIQTISDLLSGVLLTCYWHLSARARNRRQIFDWANDFRLYYELLIEASKRYGCPIHAWALMRNHVHLLVQTDDPKVLSQLLRFVNGQFGATFNVERHRSGAVWSARPRKRLIETEAFFINCLFYIELNPVKTRLADFPESHPWSSCQFHCWGKADGLTVPSPWYLGLADTQKERQSIYRQMLYAEWRRQLPPTGNLL